MEIDTSTADLFLVCTKSESPLNRSMHTHASCKVNDMKIVPGLERSYGETKAKATTPYSAAVYDVAENWANLMERVIEPANIGENRMVSVARSAYHDADTEGLTGLMYNFAAEILFRYWVYGKTLGQALKWATIDNVKLQQPERQVLEVPQEKGMEVQYTSR